MAPADEPPPQNPPAAGEVYLHYKGANYRIETVAEDADGGGPVVIYRRIGEVGFWARSLANFLSPAEVDGRPVPRFSLVHSGR